MLNSMKVSNFKGFKDVDLKLHPLTLFVGENGTGKSTVAQVMAILSRSAGGPQLFTDLNFINLGPMQNLIYIGKESSFQITGSFNLELPAQDLLKGTKVDFDMIVKFDSSGPTMQEINLSVMDWKLKSTLYRNAPGMLSSSDFPNSDVKITITHQPVGQVLIGMLTQVLGIGFQGKVDPIIQSRITQSIQILSQSVSNFLRQKVLFLSTIRGITEYSYPLLSSSSGDYTPRSGTIQMGQILSANLAYNITTSEQVSNWLREISGIEIKVKLSQGPTVIIDNPSTNAGFVNEGFGYNQLIFILERIATAPEASTIFLEEPEISLHPKAQYRLGKFLARVSREINKQLIITTHSSDLLSGISSGIAESGLDQTNTIIYYMKKDENGVQASPSTISKEGIVEGDALSSFISVLTEEMAANRKS